MKKYETIKVGSVIRTAAGELRVTYINAAGVCYCDDFETVFDELEGGTIDYSSERVCLIGERMLTKCELEHEARSFDGKNHLFTIEY